MKVINVNDLLLDQDSEKVNFWEVNGGLYLLYM